MDLFTSASTTDDGTPAASAGAPLAVRMRPASADEVLGQDHLLAPGQPLRRLLEPADASGSRRTAPASVVLWGPPGTGKTTIAYLVARASGRRFVELSAVTAGIKDVRSVVESARRDLVTSGRETVLFVDEVHRFTTTQQDALLPAVENRWVTLVAATTENPSFSVNAPLLSRSLLLTLRPLTADDVRSLVARALHDERGLGGSLTLQDDAADVLVRLAGPDARKALTILEAAAAAAEDAGDTAVATAHVEAAIDVAAVVYDRDGDQHYDVISAFIKSMRGSDVDAALHYLARMIAAGEDPRFIARRLIVHASEDVGMADPTALTTAVAAAQAVQLIGMPEGRIPLAQATIHIASAPKSNAAYLGIDEALADVRSGRSGQVPHHLRDAHYAGAERAGHGVGYRYPHDDPRGVLAQDHLPEEIADATYYRPTTHGHEREITGRLGAIRSILRGKR
ncbi:replication-associated recombination protein A [Georgenia sp. Z1491]|uniref:replication-associated recombination protein A n=1 Tax=Georgenia sp. Z1491 TaxID=3416707 RepID=UPI003CF19CB4